MGLMLRSLFAALSLSIVLAMVSCNVIKDAERPRMGHLARMADGQGIDLFRSYFGMYFEKIIAKDYGKYKLNRSDWRTYSPRSEECTRFLKSFINSNYELINMQDFILLDACLGYLYDENDFKWTDQTSDEGKQAIEALVGDEKLKRIYSDTQIEAVSSEGAALLKNTFERFFYLLNKDYYYITCDKSWINMLATFADGRESLGVLHSAEQDSYLRLLFSAVGRMGAKCFKQAAEKISSDMQHILRDTDTQIMLKDASPSLALRQQMSNNQWPMKLIRVLQVSQGVPATSAIDLSKIQQLSVGLQRANSSAQKRFLNNLGSFANANSESVFNLPIIESSYSIIKDDLCKYYRSDNVLGHDTWAELVKMLKHQDFYGRLDEVLFYNDNKGKNVNMRAQRVRPVYMATFLCRYIDLSYANVDRTQGEPLYQIGLPGDAQMIMKDWPAYKHDDIEHVELVEDSY